MAKHLKTKVAWRSAECPGVHSNSASDEREDLASPLQKVKSWEQNGRNFQLPLLDRGTRCAPNTSGVHVF